MRITDVYSTVIQNLIPEVLFFMKKSNRSLRALALMSALLLLLPACGSKDIDAPAASETEEEQHIPAAQPETDAPDAPETEICVDPPVPQKPQPVTAEIYDESFAIHVLEAPSPLYARMPWDETHELFVFYAFQRDKDGNLIFENGSQVLDWIRLSMLDTEAGEFAASRPFAGPDIPSQLMFSESGERYLLASSNRELMWKITFDGTTIGASAQKKETDTLCESRITSPDGTASAFVRTDDSGAGGVFVKSAGGAAKRILKNTATGDLQASRSYHPVCFYDDTHLLYSITGWEWSVGWGVYDLTDGKKTEFITGMSILGTAHEKILLIHADGDGLASFYSAGLDGTLTLLADKEHSPLPALSPAFGGNALCDCELCGNRVVLLSSTGNDPSLSLCVTDPEMKTLLAHAASAETVSACVVGENSVCFLISG